MPLNILEPISIFIIFGISLYLIKTRFDISIYLLMIFSVFVHKELFSFYLWDLMPVRIYMFALLTAFCLELTQNLYQKIIKKDKYLVNWRDYVNNPYIIILILLWLINGLSIIFSFNLKASILLYGFFTTVVVLFIKILANNSNRAELMEKYLKFYIFLGFILSIFGYFQLWLYQSTGHIIGSLWNVPGKLSRVGATFWDVNHYGAFLAALIPLVFVFFWTTKVRLQKIYYFIVLLSLIATLLITNSRSAWIMEFVAFVSFALILMIKKFGTKGILILLLPIILFFASIGFMYAQKSSPVRATIKQYMHYRVDSFDSHFLLLQGAFEIYQTYPILGGGYGGFFEHFSKTKVAPTFFGRDPAALTARVPAHTIWGEVLSDTGSIGFAIFLLFVGSILLTILYSAIKTTSYKVFMMCAAMFSILVGWLFAGIFYSYNAEYFWLIWAIFLTYSVAAGNLKNHYDQILEYFLASRNFSKYIILSIGAVMLFWALGNNHLIPWDEAIYAKIAKNMVTSGNYISMIWHNRAVWYEKPPLFMWFQALFMHIFGFGGWSVRLPSAIFGFLTLCLVYALSNRVFNKTAAFIAVLSLLSTTHFLYYSRTGMLDIAVTFFITLAYYFYLNAKSSDKKYYYFLTGMSIGMAIMSKGVVGLIGLFLVILVEIFRNNRMNLKQWLMTIFGLLLIAMPWHIIMYQTYGQAFLNNYIGYHVIDRASSAIEDKGNPVWWYLILIKVTMRLWAIALIAAIPFALFKITKKDYSSLGYIIWFFLVLCIFSAAKSKLAWYIIPLYPAAAILNGYFVAALLQKIQNYLPVQRRMMFKALSLYLVLLISLTYLALNSKLFYTSDLTGSQARLMVAKETIFGTETKVYLDRIELPLALYYLNGPFEIIDFTPTKLHKVPQVSPSEKLFLVTKKGRYSDTVAGYSVAPTVVQEDGDWILWFLPAKGNKVTQPL